MSRYLAPYVNETVINDTNGASNTASNVASNTGSTGNLSKASIIHKPRSQSNLI